ncbi:unnamed protein product [Auanema sp. JU1783]|nr:unnamed protein product [Auanema sp. JU1783]
MSELECLKSLVSSLTAVVSKLESAVRDIPESITKLTNHIAVVESNVSSHDTRIADLEKKLNALSQARTVKPNDHSEKPKPNLISEIIGYRAEEIKFSERSCNLLWFKVPLALAPSDDRIKSLLQAIAVLSGDNFITNLIVKNEILGKRAVNSSASSNLASPIIVSCPSKDIRDKLIIILRTNKPLHDPVLSKSYVRRDYLPSEVHAERQLRAQCVALNKSSPNLVHFVRDFKIISRTRTSTTSQFTNDTMPAESPVIQSSPVETADPVVPAATCSPSILSPDTNINNVREVCTTEPPAKLTRNLNTSKTRVTSNISTTHQVEQRFRKTSELRRSTSLPRSSTKNCKLISDALDLCQNSFR